MGFRERWREHGRDMLGRQPRPALHIAGELPRPPSGARVGADRDGIRLTATREPAGCQASSAVHRGAMWPVASEQQREGAAALGEEAAAPVKQLRGKGACSYRSNWRVERRCNLYQEVRTSARRLGKWDGGAEE